jgi:hypothetical protein
MLDLTIDLFSSADATKGFAETAKAIEENVERRALTLKVDEPKSKSALSHPPS